MGAIYYAVLFSKGKKMTKELIPIFKLRSMLLQQVCPYYFAKHSDLILRTSLAAQDYVKSGKFYEYDSRTGQTFKTLPNYINIHKKYDLPYTPTAEVYEMILNPGLVMDLAWSLNTDQLHKIVDENGNILAQRRLYESEVLHVYHNSPAHGIPLDAFLRMQRTEQDKLIANLQRTK